MRGFLLALLPFGLGLGAAVIWQAGIVPNDILYLRADTGTIVLVLGAAASSIALLAIALWNWNYRHFERGLLQARADDASAHHRFIRRLDHEIKNPLTAIRAALANLEQCDDVTLTTIRAQVDRMARLSADLRKLTELEQQPLEKEAVDVSALLTELLLLVRERPDALCCHLHLTLPQAPWPLPPILGDRDLLFLAFHNLVDNALKFSTPNDTIEIRAFEDGPSVVVEVADTGPGIGEDELPHLGEELYRGSAGRTTEGSGLGLALVQSIVTRHSGTFAARSRVGQGTVVTLRFPTAR